MRVPVRLGIKEGDTSRTLSAWTLVLNRHGARMECNLCLDLDQDILVTVSTTGKSGMGKVVWRESKRNQSGKYEFAVELQEAENLWGIEFPPGDWSPRRAPAPAASVGVREPENVREPEKVMVEVAEVPSVYELVADPEAAPLVVEEALAAAAQLAGEPVEASVAVEEHAEMLPEFPITPEPALAEPPQYGVPEHLDLTSELTSAHEPAPVPSAAAGQEFLGQPLPMISRHMSAQTFNATAAALLNALVSLLERKGYVTRDELLSEIRRFSE